jgi:hypothetical protein
VGEQAPTQIAGAVPALHESGRYLGIDITSARGKLAFGILAALAELEPGLIVEQTKAGLASARLRLPRRLALHPRANDR